MLGQRVYGASAHIAGDADFERYVVLPQMLEQPRVLDRANAVADAFDADGQRVPDALRTRRLPGVAGESQTTVARFAVEIGEPGGRAAFLAPAEADGDHAVADALGRKIEDRLCRFGAELANCIEDPAHGHTTAAGLAGKGAVDRRELLLLPQHHSGRKIDFGVGDAFVLQPLEQSSSDE